VLQPNFRGSTGFGLQHLSAGFERWGLQMQEDAVDGHDWLIAQGIASPDVVCFVGGSYGGYVSLVAAFKMPDRIRCAVSFAGVTDLAHRSPTFCQNLQGQPPVCYQTVSLIW
jgi:dipeptidyl aminopeptidase/acylaminoacyl peptidase